MGPNPIVRFSLTSTGRRIPPANHKIGRSRRSKLRITSAASTRGKMYKQKFVICDYLRGSYYPMAELEHQSYNNTATQGFTSLASLVVVRISLLWRESCGWRCL